MNQYRQPRNACGGIAAVWLGLGGLAWSATETVTPAAVATNAPRAAASVPAATRAVRPTYNSFTNIPAVNIFNAWRSPGVSSEIDGTPRLRVPTAERFALTGTLNYTKASWMAFFDGTSQEYQKVLKNEATIGGFKITEITHNGVKLEKGDQKYELKVGMQLGRPPGGDWTVSVRTDTLFASVDSSGGSEFGSLERRPRGPGGDGGFGNDGGPGGGRTRGRRGGDLGGVMTVSPVSPTSTSSSPTASTAAEVDDILKKLMEAREKETK